MNSNCYKEELDEQIRLNKELAEEYLFLYETLKTVLVNYAYGHKN